MKPVVVSSSESESNFDAGGITAFAGGAFVSLRWLAEKEGHLAGIEAIHQFWRWKILRVSHYDAAINSTLESSFRGQKGEAAGWFLHKCVKRSVDAAFCPPAPDKMKSQNMKATIKRIFGRTVLSLTIAGLTLAAQGQGVATWVNTAGDNEWTNGLNWDSGFPPDNATGTNIALLPPGFTVNYDQPMAAAAFGGVTNYAILNINTKGFNNAGVVITKPGAGAAVIINSNGVVNVTGNFGLCSNNTATLAIGGTLTISGSLIIGSNPNGTTGGTTAGASGYFTNYGGSLTASTTTLNPGNATVTTNCRLVIIGGTNNLGAFRTQRSQGGGNAPPPLGTDGLVVSNGYVNTTSMSVGNNAHGIILLANGVVTNTGNLILTNATSTRPARFQQFNGIFVDTDPSTVNMNGTQDTVYSVVGGTNIVGGIQFNGGTILLTNSALIYVGSGGITSNGVATSITALLNSGAKIGATADWTGTGPINLNGGVFDAGNLDGTPHNITFNGLLRGSGVLIKAGGGTMTLNNNNTYSGNTTIRTGTLAIGATGSISNSSVTFVASGAAFDVSAVPGGYPLNNAKTLQGFGTVLGAVNVASGATVSPGSNALTGTLTVGGLVENGGALTSFVLASNPTGPGNDFLIVNGDLDVTNGNSIQVSGSVTPSSVYPLIHYTGSFNGATNNFSIVGATGVISNDVVDQVLYLVVASALRGPTNVVWVGSATSNVWDTTTTSNWLNNGSPDFFVPGDNARFDNTGATHPLVDIPGNVTAGSVTVNSTAHYTFLDNGTIVGSGGLTKTNSGTLTILTTNTYTGPTILNGGVLEVTNLDIGGAPSSIGSASTDPANLVMSAGILRYLAPTSATTDRGINLTNSGGTIDVTGGAALTLSGNLVGPSGLTITDGKVIVTGTGNSYAGITTVANGGNLQLNSANGASTNTITLNNGTLTYSPSAGITVANAFNFTGTTNMIVVTSGAGGNNPLANGVWSGSGVLMISNTFSPYTVNASLDSFTGTILLVTPTTGGQFRFNSGGGNSMFGSSNALFDLGTGTGQLVCRNPGTMNLGGLQGGANTVLRGPTGTAGTVVWSIGNNSLNTTFAGSIQDFSGNEFSSVVKVGNGTLTLTGANTYSGPTTVNSGALEVDGFNSGIGTTLVAGTLQGGGAINGPVDIQPGGTLVPGIGGVGQLGASNSLTLESGCTNFFLVNAVTGTNTAVVGMTSTSYGGVLIVSNTAGTFVAGQKFILFGGSPNTFGGVFDSMILPALPSPLSWDTSGLLVDGSITVRAPLSFTSTSLQSGNLIMNGAGGVGNGAFDLLSSSNLTVPLSNWTLVNTFFFNPDGSFNVTNPVTPGVTRQFYMIQEQVGP